MKTVIISTIVLSSLFLQHTHAQYWVPTGSRSSSMANTSVAASDPWSVHNNPAGMAFLKQPSAGIYFENHYSLKELCYQAAALTFPTRYGVFGSSFFYSGNSFFNTLKGGIAYAMAFGHRFSAGIQLDILHTGLSGNYGSRTSGTFEAGLQVHLTDKLILGAHIFNASHAPLSNYQNERIPTVMNVGLSYSYSGILSITSEVLKYSETPAELLTGLEYKFFGKGFARLGLATSPFRYTFGTGFVFKQLTIDFSASYHEILGFSPQTSLQYTIGR
jgi:hypothetical protein